MNSPNASCHPDNPVEKSANHLKPSATRTIGIPLLALSLLLFPAVLTAATPGAGVTAVTETGTVTGRIFNPATGEYVRNAEIRVQGTSLLVYSGDEGAYRIPNVPAREVTLTVSYAGYQSATATLTPAGGQVANRDFELRRLGAEKDEVVQMSPMTVTSEIEGNAKAMMEQRAAMNVKNVVASDAFGDLSEGNVGELLQYLPGITLEYDQSDIVSAQMGGMAAKYGALMVDGVRVASSTGTARSPGFLNVNLRSAEAVELNKSSGADMDADAPAGSVNLKSKSAFQRKGRQITWQLYASANSEGMTLGRKGGPSDAMHHQIHPSGSIEFSDSYLQGRLGLIASFDRTHVIHERHRILITYNTVPTAINPDPIVITTIQYVDGPKVNRANRGNLNLDYKLNSRLTLSLRGQVRDSDTRIYDRALNLITTRNLIAPGSNASFQIANLSGTSTRLQMQGTYQERTDRAYSFTPQIVYAGDRLKLDAALAYSQVTISYRNAQPDGSGEGPVSAFIALIPVSWRLERSGPDQTAFNYQQLSGLDPHALASWQPFSPTNNVSRNGSLGLPTKKKYTGHVNASLTPEWTRPTTFKAGLKVQEEIYSALMGNNNWTYVGATGNRAEADLGTPSPVRFDPELGGNLFDRPLPWIDRGFIGNLLRTHPEYFVKNPADRTDPANVFPRRYAKEQIDAAYLMGTTQFGRLTLQGGGRYEATRTAARIYERGTLRPRFGQYDNMFMSGAAKYRFAENFMAIVGYNQSILRPDYGNLSGVLTVNDDTRIGNIPNPNLRPEYGENYSGRLEYYLKSAGAITVGVFQREVTDLHIQRSQLPAEELGLEADYPGYLFTSWANAAESFRTQGYELSYNQQLTMLPARFRGFGVFANYTRVKNNNITYAYGRTPRSAAAGVTYRYRKFSSSVRGSWSDEVLSSATLYNKARTIIGVSASYQLPRNMSVYVTGRNIFLEPIATYLKDRPDHLSSYGQFGSNWTIGMEGRF